MDCYKRATIVFFWCHWINEAIWYY